MNRTIIANSRYLVLVFNSFLFCLSFFFGSRAYTIGPGGSGGGRGVIIDQRIYLLDLVEFGIQNKDEDIDYGQTANPTLSLNKTQQKVVLKFTDHEEYRYVADGPNFNHLSRFLENSSENNKYMFGRQLTDCQLAAALCLSPEGEISIALTNRLQFGKGRTNYNLSIEMFYKKFSELRWILVDAPLKKIEDENSALDDEPKYLLARRDDHQISVFSGSWNRGFKHNGQIINPLNRLNKLGLITHEVFYAITAQQGDLNSDRARRVTSLFWGLEFNNAFADNLMTIPGHPAKSLDSAYWLSELPEGQELEIIKSIHLPMTDTYVIVPELDILTEDDWFKHYVSSERSAAVELFSANGQFQSGMTIPKGLRLKVKKVETKLMNSWYQTVVYFDRKSDFGYELDRLAVTASAGGRYPAIKDEFIEIVKKYIRLIDPVKVVN